MPISLAAPAPSRQSQALMTLASQLGQSGADPCLDAPASSTSVRGALGRQRLQAELLSSPGSFARRVRENALRRMDPSGLTGAEHPTLVRYLERFGGYGKQRNTALVAWEVAQACDHLQRGSAEAAADVMSLLLVMLEQTALDSGDQSLGWLLSLQPDPPISIFQDVSSLPSPAARAFTPLADQRWVTIALSYLKEVDAISLRRGDLAAKPAPPLPPKGPGEAEALSKKQQHGRRRGRLQKPRSEPGPRLGPWLPTAWCRHRACRASCHFILFAAGC